MNQINLKMNIFLENEIIKTNNYDIMIRVAIIDFDINSASYETNKNYVCIIIVMEAHFILEYLIIIKEKEQI